MATSKDRLRLLRLRAKAAAAAAAQPQLPDPMSEEGLALQGTRTTPQEAGQLARSGKYRQEAGIGPAIGQEGMQQAMDTETQGLDPATRFAVGAGNAVTQAGQAVKQIRGGDVSDADIQAQRQLGSAGGIAGTAGELATQVAPAMKAEGALIQTLNAAKTLPRAAIAALTAGSEASLTPTKEDESRWRNIGTGAAIATGLTGAFLGMRKGLTGMFDTTEEAARLEAEGVTGTLGQAVETKGFRPVAKTLKAIENTFDYLFTGRDRSTQEVMDAVARKAEVPLELSGIENPHRVGSPKYFNTLRKQYDEAYAKLLDPIQADAPGIVKIIDDALEGAAMEGDEAVRRLVKKDLMTKTMIPTEGLESMGGRQLKDLIREANQGVTDALGIGGNSAQEKHTARLYAAVQEEVKKLLRKAAPDSVKKLEEMDMAYAHRQLLELSRKHSKSRRMNIRGLSGALEARSDAGMTARETGTGAGLVEDASEAITPRARHFMPHHVAGLAGGAGVAVGALTAPGAIAAAAPLAALSAVGASKGGSKYLRGRYTWQGELADALRKNVETKMGTAAVGINNLVDE